MTIDTIPDAIRLALGYRAALESLGYDASDQIYIVPTTWALVAKLPAYGAIRPPVEPAPPVHWTWLLVTLSLARRFDATDIVIVTGALEPAQFAAFYPERATQAYNALPPAARNVERRRWIPVDRLIWLTSELMARGILPDLHHALATGHHNGDN